MMAQYMKENTKMIRSMGSGLFHGLMEKAIQGFGPLAGKTGKEYTRRVMARAVKESGRMELVLNGLTTSPYNLKIKWSKFSEQKLKTILSTILRPQKLLF